jgi:hypothetical protein
MNPLFGLGMQNYFFYPLVVRFVSIFFMPGIL